MVTWKIILQLVNVAVGIGLILSMVLHVTESEAGGGGGGLGFGSVGGRRSSSGMGTFFERFLGVIAIGFILTAFLHAWIAGRAPMP